MTTTERRLDVRRLVTLRPADLSAVSWDAMDGDLDGPAELVLATFAGEAVVLGAFQRARDVPSGGKGEGDGDVAAAPLVRRCSGGAAACVGPGTLYVSLALQHPSALVACDPSRIVNRHVRPLLQALTKVGAPAAYFDRDWVSVSRRPAALIGFAHDVASRRTVVEAFVCVRGALVPASGRARASFLGKAPGSLEEITGRAIDVGQLGDAVVAAYAAAYGLTVARRDATAVASAGGREIADDPPWQATSAEAIGAVAAGVDHTGRLRVGGELMVSRDALARLEAEVAAVDDEAHESARDAALEDAVNALAAPGVALAGVRTLESVLDVIRRARAARPARTG